MTRFSQSSSQWGKKDFHQHFHPAVLEGAGSVPRAARGPLARPDSLSQAHTPRRKPVWTCCLCPLTLMVSSSMRRRLFSDRRSLFLVSICCSCVSNSASYSRLPSWNSRSSSCVFSALQRSQTHWQSFTEHLPVLFSAMHRLACVSTTFRGRNWPYPHFTGKAERRCDVSQGLVSQKQSSDLHLGLPDSEAISLPIHSPLIHSTYFVCELNVE